METLGITEKQALTSFPLEGISKYHIDLQEKFEDVNPDNYELNSDTEALMTFNGFYSLNTAKGAFFAVDTNMHLNKGASKPIYDVTFIISLDGTSSKRYPFTGTFDGATLKQSSEAELSVDLNLTFKRGANEPGTTASLAGTIALPSPNSKSVEVFGSTYNNPIKYEIYEGTYYNKIKSDQKNQTSEKVVKALEINAGYEILFDYASNDGVLTKVPSFTYNLNMYFFSFRESTKEEDITYHLIMGTGAAKGLVAGNMIITTPKKGEKTLVSRNLLTIPNPSIGAPGLPNLKGGDLANFSGYYTVPSIHPRAFLSIQAEYSNVDGLDIYGVIISYSLDGITSNGVYFDEGSMTFNNNTLTIPSEELTITFNRGYNSTNGSLISVSGKIGVHEVQGYTPFNPVPLTAFGGVTLTSQIKNSIKASSLEIINENEIVFNGTPVKSFIYVPLMYILAFPIENPEYVLSFGPDGLKGNSCIITEVKNRATSFVYAIHNTTK